MSKTYKGYELMREVSEGRLQLEQKVNSTNLYYENCTISFVLNDFAIIVMNLDFELVKDKTDIQEIEELDEEIVWKNLETAQYWSEAEKKIVKQQNAILEWAKQIDKRIREE